jgi:predicted nucleotidyltransferase
VTTIVDPILSRFRAALDKTYGERVERVVLFGSRARGDARPDSDYDIAVFLRTPDSFFGKNAAASRGSRPISSTTPERSSTPCHFPPGLIATIRL